MKQYARVTKFFFFLFYSIPNTCFPIPHLMMNDLIKTDSFPTSFLQFSFSPLTLLSLSLLQIDRNTFRVYTDKQKNK